MATPFVMASSQTMQQAAAAGMSASVSSSAQLNGSGSGSGLGLGGSTSTSSPRAGQAWGVGAPPPPPSASAGTVGAAPDESTYRPSGRPEDPHNNVTRSPVQAHRYTPAPGATLARMPSSGSGSASTQQHQHQHPGHRMSSPPPPSQGRSRPTHSPRSSYSASLPGVASPKTQIRPLSPPPPTNIGSGSGVGGGNLKPQTQMGAGAGYTSSPRLSGPGRTATPTGGHPLASSAAGGASGPALPDAGMKNGAPAGSSFNVGSRTASPLPLMSSLHPPLPSSMSGPPPPLTSGGRPPANGVSSGLDRERELASGALNPSLQASQTTMATMAATMAGSSKLST
ncbi:hypothetical protein CVT26_000720 [Gymnopilus dilepis]|uniref:Uncharacterized protein n=1 Tax=Gymnopilus dilepis TaxID=231916 RepID=A0A409Y2H5_9AGAR|nr:hypothetical protein CVT26_000720 [Gymnopilus dilepis]